MNTGWEIREQSDISFWHCDRAAYWENDEVFCSKCQEQLIDKYNEREN